MGFFTISGARPASHSHTLHFPIMTDDADDADLCIACKVKIAEIIFLPCCHVVYCTSCNTRAPAKSACPLCRAPVDFTRPASRVVCPDDPEKQSRLLINCLQTSAFRSLVAVFATILVIAVTLMGSRLCIRLDKTKTVMETLLKQVEVIKGIPVSQQRWIHNGHQLSPDRLVQTYDLETSDTIYLVVGPMRGC